MELNLRTVLVVLAAIVMLGILIDGFRRMRRARQEALKLDVKQDFQFPEDGFSSELPNGGARVIGTRGPDELKQEAQHFRDQLDDLPGMSALDEVEEKALHELDSDVQESLHEERVYAGEPDFQHDSYQHLTADTDDTLALNEQEKPDFDSTLVEQASTAENIDEEKPEIEKATEINTSETVSAVEEDEPSLQDYASEQLVPKAKPLNLDEQVPLLMDVEELGDELDVTSIQHSEPEINTSVEGKQSEATENLDLNQADTSDAEIDQHIELGPEDIAGIQASVDDIALLSPMASNAEEEKQQEEAAELVEDGRRQAEDMMAQAAYAPVKKPGIHAESLDTRPEPSLVLVTHVIPHDEEGFCGEDILYLVNSCDLRHGEKNIFHRFEKENGEGRVQFSMANSFNPGTFNPETLLHERIHGLSLFMSLPGPEKAMDAFEAMTEMASVIARNLGGDVHDETHSIMALQTIEHNRQQVRDFVRKQKLAQKK